MFNSEKEFFKKITLYFPEILYFSVGKQNFIRTSIDQVWNLIYFLKQHTYGLFKQLVDLSFIDYPERKYRFELFYHLLSFHYNNRLTITTSFPEGVYLDSITNIFPGANWYERESWDMFGGFFRNHPDLRRMLTDYGFKGHPLRKDFPLTGYIEVRYDDFLKRILYEEVSLAQEYRIFSLENNWTEINSSI